MIEFEKNDWYCTDTSVVFTAPGDYEDKWLDHVEEMLNVFYEEHPEWVGTIPNVSYIPQQKSQSDPHGQLSYVSIGDPDVPATDLTYDAIYSDVFLTLLCQVWQPLLDEDLTGWIIELEGL